MEDYEKIGPSFIERFEMIEKEREREEIDDAEV